ncbi:MAG: hypothetical protein WD226_06525 [Planctomycetota bacterium]
MLSSALVALFVVAFPAHLQQRADRGWIESSADATAAGARSDAWHHPSADRRLAPGEFAHPAGIDGPLLARTTVPIDEAGRYRFAVRSVGVEARLLGRAAGGTLEAHATGDGSRVWTPFATLERGTEVELELWTEAASGGGAARSVEVWWEAEWHDEGGFPPERLSSRHTRVPSDGETHGASRRVREGLSLLREKACHACHAGLPAAEPVAPRLEGLGARVGAEWLDRWLADPHAVRPGTDMPRLPALADDDERDALLHHLLATGSPTDDVVANEARVVTRGRDLYHSVGCVACHGALVSARELRGDPTLDDAIPAVDVVRPFGDLEGKWWPTALSAFLLDPDATHPAGTMPRMRLSDDEADSIATYLVSTFGEPAPFVADPARGLAGAAVFERENCGSCHVTPGGDAIRPFSSSTLVLPAARAGCLADEPRGAPAFELTHRERSALERALVAVSDGTGAWGASAPTPLFDHRETLDRLACGACHAIEGVGGVSAEFDLYFEPRDERVDLGDEGRLPPKLEQPGVKFTTGWLREILLERGVARPYLNVRMPEFRSDLVEPLVHGFAALDGVVPDTDAPGPTATDELALTGRDLVARGNFGCITCHVFGDRPPNGSPGPALDELAHRLRWEWVKPYLANPQRFSPGSRMPNFGEGRVSSVPGVLDGDLERQIDALWAYLSLGDAMPAPDGLVQAGALTIDPVERAVVLRGFLDGAGSRAIAVGLPVGVHFAYDAETARLAYAWRGDFLDASGAWAGRGGTQYGGQGARVWTAPDAGLLGDETRFLGYSLDADGRPTFRSSRGGVRLEEAFGARVAPELVITRSLALHSDEPGATFWLPVGPATRVAIAIGCNARIDERDGQLGVAVQLREAASQGSLVLEVRP